LKDEMIEKIAFCNPKTLEDLEKFGFKTRMLNGNLKSEIIRLILSKPLVDNGDDYPKLPFKMSDEQKNLYQKSKILLQEKAIEYQISPELIVNQSNLSSLVFGYKAIPDILPSWRYEVFGRDLENILKIL
jgi:ribonuclease D